MNNTKEYVLVPKKEFEEIITKYLEMMAGEGGGVDNWHYWSESLNDFIKDYNNINGTNCNYIEEVAQDYMENYQIITMEEK